MTTFPLAVTPSPRRNLGRIYRLEAKYELLKMLRLPAYVLPTLGFPLFFYLLFGVSFSSRVAGSFPMATYLIATYGAFGIISASLFGFGVGVAVERGQGWLLLKRASPMPLSAYFLAKLAMASLFGVLITLSLSLLGATVGGVHLSLGRWLGLGATLVAGGLPFCAMGLAFGYLAGPNSAPAIINLVNLPMAFLSGLWLPVEMLPKLLQRVAPLLPPYHYGRLAVAALGLDVPGVAGGGSVSGHVSYLVAFTVACLGVAWAGFRRDDGRTYG